VVEFRSLQDQAALSDHINISTDGPSCFYVSDWKAQPRRVLVLDRHGGVLDIIGRSGSGAGEFQMPLHPMIAKDDSLVILNVAAGRLSVFDRDYRFVRRITPATGIGRPSCLMTVPW
jgi:hypothetical protein